MIINKSQGQSLNYVGPHLPESVFTHGQFYISSYFTSHDANLRIIVPDTDETRREGKIRNIGYQKYLINRGRDDYHEC